MATFAGVPQADSGSKIQQQANPLAALLPMLTQAQTSQTKSGGTGDVSGLQALLAALMPTTNAAGMDPVIRAIFQQGFEKQMPQLYNAANQAGVRPGSSTQQQLMLNDLNARLSAEAAKAVSQQQQTAGQVATAIAQNTKTPEVVQKTDRTGIDKTNALLGAALLAGTKIFGGMNKGGEVATTGAPGSAGDVFGTKKRNPEGGFDVQAVLDSVFGPADGGLLSMPTSTGGINSNANMFSGTGGAGGFDTGNFMADLGMNLLQGNSFDNTANSLATNAAIMAVPGGQFLQAADAIGSLFGINEVSGITGGIKETVSDAASGIWDTAGDIGSAIVKPFGCYITTAICELEGKPDDCSELETLRKFRDEWLEKQPAGKELVAQYYDQAPRFLSAVAKSGFKEQMLRNFSDIHIKPAVAAAQRGDNELAFRHYVDMLADANDYIKHMER